MDAVIINVGSEFLYGRTPRSGPLIADYFSSLGIKVKQILTVGDDAGEIASAVKCSLEKAEITALSGGMGSSPGDLSMRGVSGAIKMETGFSREAMENVAAYFAGLGKEVPKCCDSQAEVFRDAKILFNSRGSCPGQLLFPEKGKTLILLPGVPEEVESIFKRSLYSLLKEKYERGIRKKALLRLAGKCEGLISGDLAKIIESEKHLEKGELDFYFEKSGPGTDIVIVASGGDEILIDELLHKTKAEIIKLASDHIYGENGITLPEAAGRLLAGKRKTVSVAESCTGGLISSKMTDVPGSSVYFDRGIVAYSNRAKEQLLNISPQTIKRYKAVSPQMAIEMAENLKEISSSGYSLSITGYAGPPSRDEKRKGAVAYGALSGPFGTESFEIKFTGSRSMVKEKFSYACIEQLWRKLKE